MSKDVFDPEHVSPLVAYLATENCEFNGQVFSVYGGGVGIYQGWSIAEDVPTAGLTPEELAVALDKLPRKVKVNRQMHAIAAASQ